MIGIQFPFILFTKLNMMKAFLFSSLSLSSIHSSLSTVMNDKFTPSNRAEIVEKRRFLKEGSHVEKSSVTLPSPRSDLTTALGLAPSDNGGLGLGIYLIGGCEYYGIFSENGDEQTHEECASVTDNMWVYDPFNDFFIGRRKMPIARFRHVSVSMEGDSIWVITGRDDQHNLLDQIDVYNPERDEWTILPDRLPPELQISDGAAFSIGSKLYIVGGYNSNYEATDTTFVIDTAATIERGELVYKVLNSMGTPRGDISAIVFGRFAYVVGGFTHQNGFCTPLRTTEVYDLMKNEWTSGADLNVGRGDVSLVTFNDRIFALGGETTYIDEKAPVCRQVSNPAQTTNYAKKIVTKRYPVNSVEMFTPDQDEQHKQRWKLAYSAFLPPDNAVFRFVANAFPENNVIYAFGGLMYDEKDFETGSIMLKTSDSVTLYVDDFKHGRFHGSKFGSSSFFSSLDELENLRLSHSSIVIILIGAAVIFSTCGILFTRIHSERKKRIRLHRETMAKFHGAEGVFE